MKLAFAGGDLRMSAAAELFKRDGADVICAFLGEDEETPAAENTPNVRRFGARMAKPQFEMKHLRGKR